MMGTEMVPETSVIFNQMTELIAREHFIKVCCHESFTVYITNTWYHHHNHHHILSFWPVPVTGIRTALSVFYLSLALAALNFAFISLQQLRCSVCSHSLQMFQPFVLIVLSLLSLFKGHET